MAGILDYNYEYTMKVSKCSLIEKIKWTLNIWLSREVDIKIKMKVKENE